MKKNTSEGLKNVTKFLVSLVGQPREQVTYKTNPIKEDYKISTNVLGLGISGQVIQQSSFVYEILLFLLKVLECFDQNGQKFALKVLKDNAKSRREISLHWRASGCKHIVNIKDVYENTYNGQKCLLVVMEW